MRMSAQFVNRSPAIHLPQTSSPGFAYRTGVPGGVQLLPVSYTQRSTQRSHLKPRGKRNTAEEAVSEEDRYA